MLIYSAVNGSVDGDSKERDCFDFFFNLKTLLLEKPHRSRNDDSLKQSF